jgi:hypothetical protein
MADPWTRIVSLTITHRGYNFHPVSGEFDETNPAVQADLAPGPVPATTFGLVTEALVRRRFRGIESFTVMSCDNIPGNGRMAQEVFTAFASLRDPELGKWVESNVRFPNSMVDHRACRSTSRHAAAHRRPAASGHTGLRQESRALRRSGERAGVHRAVPVRAEFLAHQGRSRHAGSARHALPSSLNTSPAIGANYVHLNS